MMRQAIVLLCLALLGAPLAAEAQQPEKVHQIGLLSGWTATGRALRSCLGELGWIEGKNFMIEDGFADGRMERLPQIAADLVARRVDVIVAMSNQKIVAAQRAIRSIPIVMVFGAVPVEAGFVASLAPPGGNITGRIVDAPQIAGKWIEVFEGNRADH